MPSLYGLHSSPSSTSGPQAVWSLDRGAMTDGSLKLSCAARYNLPTLPAATCFVGLWGLPGSGPKGGLRLLACTNSGRLMRLRPGGNPVDLDAVKRFSEPGGEERAGMWAVVAPQYQLSVLMCTLLRVYQPYSVSFFILPRMPRCWPSQVHRPTWRPPAPAARSCSSLLPTSSRQQHWSCLCTCATAARQ